MSIADENQEHWQKLKDVFSEVVELSPDERGAYLSQLRLGENTIYRELAGLLEIEPEAENFLSDPLKLTPIALPLVSLIGETIGHYKIVREIQRGGMGTVYEAIRFDGEFEQRVAVKLINYNFVNDDLLKRFKKERQILATLEHNNIVRLLDGGFTGDQIPYYVMEYVEGTPINRYSRTNQLETDQILRLFLQVCDAVAYAHRQLIVHRDLKPSNILVTKAGQVKLLDFGIAKILDLGSAAQTQTQNAPLTPAYSSPEQIKGEQITTASDIFSLGTVLYEILTEKSPHEFYGVRQIDVLRGACELEPIRPSAVLFQSTSDIKTTESNRESSATSGRNLKGDLDNIILKALRKEKEERYSSVEQFSGDIESYLKGLPVRAHPQSFKYRAVKFIKRNRWAVALTSAAILMIAGGMILAVWQSLAAQRQRKIAEQRFDQVRKIANSLILDYHDEIAKLDGSTKIREKLVVDARNYLDAVSQEETDNPELLKELAAAYRKIGDVKGAPYDANLGKSDEALENYQKSVTVLEKASALAPSDISLKDELVKSYKSLAQGETRSGNKAQARLTLQKAIAINEEIALSDKDNLERKISALNLRLTLGDTGEGNHNEDLAIYKQVLTGAEVLYVSHPQDVKLIGMLLASSDRVGRTLKALGENEDKKGNAESARQFYQQAVEYTSQSLYYDKLRQSMNPSGKINKRSYSVSYINLASIQGKVGQTDEAMKNVRIAENFLQDLITADPNNREILLDKVAVLNDKRKILAQQGKSAEALECLQQAFNLAKESYQFDPLNVEAISWIGYLSQETASILSSQRKEKEADKYRQIFQDYEKQFKEKFGTDWTFGF